MRGLKAALLLGLVALIGWGLLNVGQLILTLYPDYRFWHVGAAIACVYALGDLADRSREWLGWRGERRAPRRSLFRRWH